MHIFNGKCIIKNLYFNVMEGFTVKEILNINEM